MSLEWADSQLREWSVVFVTELQGAVAGGAKAALIGAYLGDVAIWDTFKVDRPERIGTVLNVVRGAVGCTVITARAVQLHFEKNPGGDRGGLVGRVGRGRRAGGDWLVWGGGRKLRRGWRLGRGRWRVRVYWWRGRVHYRRGVVVEGIHPPRARGTQRTATYPLCSWLNCKEDQQHHFVHEQVQKAWQHLCTKGKVTANDSPTGVWQTFRALKHDSLPWGYRNKEEKVILISPIPQYVEPIPTMWIVNYSINDRFISVLFYIIYFSIISNLLNLNFWGLKLF